MLERWGKEQSGHLWCNSIDVADVYDPSIGCFFHISYCVLGIGGALKQIWTSVSLGSKPMLHLSPLSIPSANLGSEVETMKEMQKGVTSLKVVTLCVLGCFLVVVLLFFLPWSFCTKESGI